MPTHEWIYRNKMQALKDLHNPGLVEVRKLTPGGSPSALSAIHQLFPPNGEKPQSLHVTFTFELEARVTQKLEAMVELVDRHGQYQKFLLCHLTGRSWHLFLRSSSMHGAENPNWRWFGVLYDPEVDRRGRVVVFSELYHLIELTHATKLRRAMDTANATPY